MSKKRNKKNRYFQQVRKTVEKERKVKNDETFCSFLYLFSCLQYHVQAVIRQCGFFCGYI